MKEQSQQMNGCIISSGASEVVTGSRMELNNH